MKTTLNYSVGDLVIIPPYTPAVTQDPMSKSMIDFVTSEDCKTIGIVTDIMESENYGEITVLVGHNFVYIPMYSSKPDLIKLEKSQC